MTWGGGSSIVLSRALKAEVDSMCTSSMMYTLYWQTVGRKAVSSRRSRMSSTLLLEAASISETSRTVPSSMPRQTSQTPQGSGLEWSRQLMALAKILAQVVLPVPRGSGEQVGVADAAGGDLVLQGP